MLEKIIPRSEQRTSLARWDNEGGAGPGPKNTRVQSMRFIQNRGQRVPSNGPKTPK
jgi:hypothetical protein